jgi:hypothetical protein
LDGKIRTDSLIEKKKKAHEIIYNLRKDIESYKEKNKISL